MFKLKKRTLVLDHRLYDIYYDDVEFGNKETISDFLVVAGKNRSKEFLTGVAILPIFEGKIGLIKIYRHPVERTAWEAPRGFVDKGEKGKVAALRELEEEMGLSCDTKSLVHVGYTTPDSGLLSARITLFIAPSCSKLEQFEMKEAGHRELRFLNTSEVDTLIKASQIEEATTLILYYYYRNSLK